MDAITFPVSGLSIPLWLPLLVGAAIAFFTTMVGISGAFLLMPFQISVLSYASPAASATTLVYNLVSIPGAAWQYQREQGLWWRLALIITAGGAPGTWLGAWLRTHYLAERHAFESFVAFVLLYLGGKLLVDVWRHPAPWLDGRPALPIAALLGASFVVGVVGTIYGIGGGSLMVPICVSFFRLPVHAVAGATLTATFLTSLFALAAYILLPAPTGLATQPDWALGALFGVGGLIGGNLGARCQHRVPQTALKLLLVVILLGLALRYLVP
jgi:uncharacterized protein